MQLEIYTPAEGQPLPPIEWNFSNIRAWLEDGLAAYKGRIYTEDTIKEAKKDAAALRKLREAIDGKRKEMKGRYLAPYQAFEAQAKELTGMIDTQVAEIAAQITAFDEARKAEKQAHIKEMYSEIMADLAELVPYEKIHDKRWLNVTTPMAAIESEIIERAEAIRAALASIDALGLPEDMAGQVKAVYLDRLDLAAALAEKERIERKRQALAEYEARKKQEEDRKVLDASDPTALEKARTGDVVRFGGPGCESADEAESLLTVDFRIWATSSQLAALKSFLLENNIKYGKVPQ